jgi:chlorite dismutase
MVQPIPRILNYFSLFSFTDAYWMLNENAKGSFHEHWLAGLSVAATNFDIYQNTNTKAELLTWCAVNAEEPCAVSDFFEKWAMITTPYRHLIQPVDSLWGFAHPAELPEGDPAQVIDPFATTRMTYLVAYPFSRKAEWYTKSDEERKIMVDERLRIGEKYPEIKQMVLHTFGVQEPEYFAVYETEDLLRFAEFVDELRAAEARQQTLKKTPVYTAVYHPAPQTLGLWK